MNRQLVGILVCCAFCAVSAVAKRVAAKVVPPVVANGIRYSAKGDGRNSFVVATDEATGKNLWRVKVFHTRIEFWRVEQDNQWIFISDMKLDGNSLLVRNEKNRCYAIFLNTRRVKGRPCANLFPPQEPR
jgi:hypothetical protein